jgi:hypothetical protein
MVVTAWAGCRRVDVSILPDDVYPMDKRTIMAVKIMPLWEGIYAKSYISIQITNYKPSTYNFQHDILAIGLKKA